MKVDIDKYRYNIDTSRINSAYLKLRFPKVMKWERINSTTKFDKMVIKFFDVVDFVLDQTINRIFPAPLDRHVSVKLIDDDVYSADTTLAHVIVPVLDLFVKKLKAPNTIYGHPTNIEKDDYPDDLSEDEGWIWIVEEMKKSFNTALYDWESQFASGDIDCKTKEVMIDGVKMLEWEKGDNYTYKIDTLSKTAYYETVKNGKLLFAKYYDNLWL